MRTRSELLTLIAIAAAVLAGCQNPQPEPLPPISADTPVSSETQVNPTQIAGPATDEPEQLRGPVFIDQAELLIRESFPIQVDLHLAGSLPTPCATLRWTVGEPDEEGRIEVEAYSSQDAALACIQVLHEFEQNIPLGAYSTGSYSVWLNGEEIGEFGS